MPSKKKQKYKSKKAVKNQIVEFDLSFTDVTMVESEGVYDRVKELLEQIPQPAGWINRYKPHFSKISDTAGTADWNITTFVSIQSPFGTGQMELNLRADKSIYIIDYSPSTGNIYNNPDLSALSRWSQVNGWKYPQPVDSLVMSNVTFWRQMWETLVVDSHYLDDRFGLRKTLDMRDVPKTPMEIAEDEEMGLL